MSSGDMQASVNNLTHTERIQQASHRLPIVHQEQNAEKVMKDARQRLQTAPEADVVEGKITDSKQGKGQNPKKKKRAKSATPKGKITKHNTDGLFIDCDA